jgi:hypothetical protein
MLNAMVQGSLREVCKNTSAMQEEFGLTDAELEIDIHGLDAYGDLWLVGRLVANALLKCQGASVPSMAGVLQAVTPCLQWCAWWVSRLYLSYQSEQCSKKVHTSC